MRSTSRGCDTVYHVRIEPQYDGLEISVSYGSSASGRWSDTINLCELQIKCVVIHEWSKFLSVFTSAPQNTTGSPQVCAYNSQECVCAYTVMTKITASVFFNVFSRRVLLGVTQVSQQVLLVRAMDPRQVCNS